MRHIHWARLALAEDNRVAFRKKRRPGNRLSMTVEKLEIASVDMVWGAAVCPQEKSAKFLHQKRCRNRPNEAVLEVSRRLKETIIRLHSAVASETGKRFRPRRFDVAAESAGKPPALPQQAALWPESRTAAEECRAENLKDANQLWWGRSSFKEDTRWRCRFVGMGAGLPSFMGIEGETSIGVFLVVTKAALASLWCNTIALSWGLPKSGRMPQEWLIGSRKRSLNQNAQLESKMQEEGELQLPSKTTRRMVWRWKVSVE